MNEKLLNVPFSRQENDYFCGPAVLQMILKSFGIEKPQKELAKEARSNKKSGTFHRNMRRVAGQNGLKVFTKTNGTLREVLCFIERGLPVVVNYIEPEGESHYAIIVGCSGKDLFFNDPWHGKNFHITKKEFESRWYNFRKTSFRWFMVVTQNTPKKK